MSEGNLITNLHDKSTDTNQYLQNQFTKAIPNIR